MPWTEALELTAARPVSGVIPDFLLGIPRPMVVEAAKPPRPMIFAQLIPAVV